MTACGPSEVPRCDTLGGVPPRNPGGQPPARPSRPGQRSRGGRGRAYSVGSEVRRHLGRSRADTNC
eukprot:13233475-Alexandrium_andersonii.AAC.1